VWSQQEASRDFEHVVGAWAPQIDRILRETAGQRNPSEWFKKEECWLQVSGLLPKLTNPVPPEFDSARGNPNG